MICLFLKSFTLILSPCLFTLVFFLPLALSFSSAVEQKTLISFFYFMALLIFLCFWFLKRVFPQKKMCPIPGAVGMLVLSLLSRAFFCFRNMAIMIQTFSNSSQAPFRLETSSCSIFMSSGSFKNRWSNFFSALSALMRTLRIASISLNISVMALRSSQGLLRPVRLVWLQALA